MAIAVTTSNWSESPDSHGGRSKLSRSLTSLVFELVRPYRKWLLLIFLAMVIEAAMSLAAPWPLKVIIGNVISHRPLPEWLGWIGAFSIGQSNVELIILAAASVVVIAAIASAAGYFDSYFTESVAQYVADDLRRRLYHHLQRLSLSYYDTHQIGNVLSTMTSDVSTTRSLPPRPC